MTIIQPSLTAHLLLKNLHEVCCFTSVEAPPEQASNSELRRWIEQGAVLVNGERITPSEMMDFPIISFVLFPKSEKRRTTLL